MYSNFVLDQTLINEFFRNNTTINELKIPHYEDFIDIFHAYKGLRKLTVLNLTISNIELMIKNGMRLEKLKLL
jgi:hypothetical protein